MPLWCARRLAPTDTAVACAFKPLSYACVNCFVGAPQAASQTLTSFLLGVSGLLSIRVHRDFNDYLRVDGLVQIGIEPAALHHYTSRSPSGDSFRLRYRPGTWQMLPASTLCFLFAWYGEFLIL